MDSMKKEEFWARDLRPGMELRSTFLATDTAVRTDSRGVHYLSMRLVDRTGFVDARMWRLPRELQNGMPRDEYVRVEGQTHEYRGMLQMKLRRLWILDRSEIEESDYLPATVTNSEELAMELELAAEEFEDQHLKRLFSDMMADEGFREAFRSAPAAKAMHHARIGGLLEHAVCCMKVARSLAELYPVNRDLLIFGAIFHDVGKIEELSWGSGGFAYTTEGRLQGHVVLGERIVRSYIERIPDFPQELALQISHILLSHQGEMQYGSPAEPKTLEALLIHLVDNLDARVAMFAETTCNVSEGGWSHHENPLERALYIPHGSAMERDFPEKTKRLAQE